MLVAATGHRPDKLGGYDNAEADNRLRVIAHHYLIKTSPVGVITGMALGWDQRVAEAALLAGIPFIAAVPFAGQESRWPACSKAVYRELMTQAHGVYIVSPGGYDAAKMHKRNEWMVNHADRIVALWNGGADGGTAACVRYAQARNKPIDNLWNEFCPSHS